MDRGLTPTGTQVAARPAESDKDIERRDSGQDRCASLSFGSRTSRRASPKKLKDSTTRKMAMPGERVSQGARSMVSKALRNMPPQVGVGGFTPTPKKLSEASSKIAEATERLACTITGAKQLGIRCLSMMRS